jgi:hypothetical protein
MPFKFSRNVKVAPKNLRGKKALGKERSQNDKKKGK